MKRTKRLAALALSLALAASISGCQPAGKGTPSATPSTTPIPSATGLYTPGTYTATAQGFGGEVAVTMTFAADSITEVTLVGDKETPDIGSKALETMPQQIKAAQSAEVDGVSGATMTSKAIKVAAADCIGQAKGETGTVAVKMAPGTYTAYAESYRPRDGLHVTVEVDETKILGITVDKENTSDTSTILQAAMDHLIPRIIDHQSVSIDAITGATASSNAIKAATELALVDALKAGGSDAAAIKNFYVSVAKSNKQETLDTEVLVIGMGGAGTTAALSAAEAGLQVLAIDKAGKYGGTSSITSEGLFVNPTRFQEEHNDGKEYTDADVMYNAWVDYCEGEAKADLIHRMIYESGQVLDWLVYDHGVGFAEPQTGFTPSDVYLTKYQWLPNEIMYNKAQIGVYFDGLWRDYESAGGSYLLETEGYELICDKTTNEVTGAKARNLADGTEYTINAKAVVLATGGYAGSADLQEQLLRDDYFPIKGVWKHLGTTQNDGKMLVAAMDIGAGLYNESIPPEVHNSGTESWMSTQFDAHYLDGVVGEVLGRPAFWTEGDLPANMGWSADSLAVDKDGRRFTSETQVSFLGPWISGPNYYSIWSAEQVEQLKTVGFDTDRSGPSQAFLGSGHQIPMNTPVPNLEEVMTAAEAAGIVVKADTLEELAGKLGMDPATLTETVSTYNNYCAEGEDKMFGKPAELLDKVDGGPYYCVVMASYCYGSCGGLDINADFEVLQEDGTTAISGLYAIGTDSMGVLFTETKPYVTYGGANNGWSMVSGYLCGKELAEKLGK